MIRAYDVYTVMAKGAMRLRGGILFLDALLSEIHWARVFTGADLQLRLGPLQGHLIQPTVVACRCTPTPEFKSLSCFAEYTRSRVHHTLEYF